MHSALLCPSVSCTEHTILLLCTRGCFAPEVPTERLCTQGHAGSEHGDLRRGSSKTLHGRSQLSEDTILSRLNSALSIACGRRTLQAVSRVSCASAASWT